MNQTELKRIRVLLVDDSQAFRSLMHHEFARTTDIEIVSYATNGKLAIPRIGYYQPDFVVLDQEMPEMDGLSALKIIREKWPGIRVIMFSSATAASARITLRALELGAVDFVPKPSGEIDVPEYLQRKLISRIRDLASSPVLGSMSPRPKAESEATQSSPPELAQRPIRICVIGVSTGGPVALRELLQRLSKQLSGPIVVVQHMPPVFTKQLAEHLSSVCGLRVIEAENGQSLENGSIYIAPGGRHLELSGTRETPFLRVFDADPELHCKPSVNVLFRSASRVFGTEVLALIMTGMGEDGLDGIRNIKQAGGRVLAQSAESCVVFGMPAGPIREGLADEVLDPQGLADAISSAMTHGATV